VRASLALIINIKTIQLLQNLHYQRFGVLTIVKEINTVACQFKFLESIKIHPMFHVSLLESYHAFTIPGKTHEPSPPIVVDGEQKYKV